MHCDPRGRRVYRARPVWRCGNWRHLADQEDLVVDALAVLSQHLIVLLDPDQIVGDMHDAYLPMRLDETSYGCFMMGR
jgi:hypothetical protein